MEQIFFGSVPVTDTDILHDSTRNVFRTPLGAVPCGTEVELALRVGVTPEVFRAVLCVLRGETTDRIDMAPADSGDGMLRARYIVPGAEHGGIVLWYWFELVMPDGALCYYGADPPYMSGLGRLYPNPPPAFQLTVYDAGFSSPDWAKSAIMYQIFPDRFCKGNPDSVRTGIEYHRQKGRDEIELHENWDDIPVYEAKDGRKYYMPSDIFGGDLEGIRKQLPYLKSLGITLLYLNPIFESSSNHGYNTGDYFKIDPVLGDEAVFRKLAADARDAGIRIILDGVFSHTGDDSVYFNKYGRYDSVGAYQSPESRYAGWYRFSRWPDNYASWWGFESLPEVNEHDTGWRDFIISGEDSVVRHWLSEGASGYRLDVADELPDETIEQLRAAVKETDADALLLGEVWEDATTKQSYGRPRTYALGRGLDSVMNYPFLNRTVEFLKGRTGAGQYIRFLEHQRHTYPAPMYYTLMNLISSHDVCRIRSVLSRDFDASSMPREEQAHFELSEEEYALGGRRQRLAAAIQYALPGIPSVYYGDEAGMTGLLDPFNRRTFSCEDADLKVWYTALGELRRAYPVMSTGHVQFLSTNDILGVLRHTVNGHDFFGREIDASVVLAVVNPTGEQHRIVFDLREASEGLQLSERSEALVEGVRNAAGLLGGGVIPLEKDLFEIDAAPFSAEFYRII